MPSRPTGAPSDEIGVLAGVLVSVSPRRRVRSQADVVRLIVALALIGVGVLVATWLRNTIGGAEEDLVDVYERVPDRFAEALTGLAVLGAGVVPLVALVVLVVRRRFRQALTLLSAGVGATLAMQLLTEFLADQGIIAGIDPDTDRIVELTSSLVPHLAADRVGGGARHRGHPLAVAPVAPRPVAVRGAARPVPHRVVERAVRSTW